MAKKRMKLHKWRDLKARTLSPEAGRRVDEAVMRDAIEMTLQGLREFAGKRQTDVAEIMKKTQGELSKVEHRRDLLLSTLREYVEALGGQLEIRAVFDDRSIIVNPLLADEKTAA
jgi:hypothetical protein